VIFTIHEFLPEPVELKNRGPFGSFVFVEVSVLPGEAARENGVPQVIAS